MGRMGGKGRRAGFVLAALALFAAPPHVRADVEKDEYEHYTGEAWQSRTTHGGIDADDVLEIVKRNTQGKVSFVRGDDDTSLSGIAFGVGGRHTWASQFVTVQTRWHMVVIASDN